MNPTYKEHLWLVVSLARLYHFFFFTQYFTWGGKSERVWYITVEQSVQATTAFARRLLWPPRQPQSKLTTCMRSAVKFALACGCQFTLRLSRWPQ